MKQRGSYEIHLHTTETGLGTGLIVLPGHENCLLFWGLGTDWFLFSFGQNPISSKGDALLCFTGVLTSSRWEGIIYLQALLLCKASWIWRLKWNNLGFIAGRKCSHFLCIPITVLPYLSDIWNKESSCLKGILAGRIDPSYILSSMLVMV